MASNGYLMFVWTPTGYELREADGEPPEPGSVVDVDERREQVTKIGPSPLPGDERPCVYLQG
jgi:hypothetical protein